MKAIQQLLELMQQLRDPQHGCPWDLQQDFQSIAPYTIEEAYEVADAIERNHIGDLKEELGDLLFQVIFHSQMAQEQQYFDFEQVVEACLHKMTERHPHVFGRTTEKPTAAQQSQTWEQQKSQPKDSVLDGIADNLPELLKAVKLTKYAAVIGFDWPDVHSVLHKLDEEVAELKQAINEQSKAEMQDELGDLMFVCANIARHLQIDPAATLRHANRKFKRRFQAVEKAAKRQQPNRQKYDLRQLDLLWHEVKKQE